MMLLKISYGFAFLGAAICAIAAITLSNLSLFSPAIVSFIGGSVIAGLDRIVELLTPTPITNAVPQAEPDSPFVSGSVADLVRNRRNQ
jgi:hypothetical protein